MSQMYQVHRITGWCHAYCELWKPERCWSSVHSFNSESMLLCLISLVQNAISYTVSVLHKTAHCWGRNTHPYLMKHYFCDAAWIWNEWQMTCRFYSTCTECRVSQFQKPDVCQSTFQNFTVIITVLDCMCFFYIKSLRKWRTIYRMLLFSHLKNLRTEGRW